MVSGGRRGQHLSMEEAATVDNMFQELDQDTSDSISFEEWVSEGLMSAFNGLMGNTMAFQEYENAEDEVGLGDLDLSFH